MTRMRGSASKDLGHRAFGTAGGMETSRETPGRFGEIFDMEEEILRKPVLPLASRVWKPRSGRIYSFPVRTVVEKK